jgi:hypothetical protein
MGSIKNKKNEVEHQLTNVEFNYIMNVNKSKQNMTDEYNRVMAAFLKYISSTRLGYKDDAHLQFELNFTDESHILKVTELPSP